MSVGKTIGFVGAWWYCVCAWGAHGGIVPQNFAQLVETFTADFVLFAFCFLPVLALHLYSILNCTQDAMYGK